MKLKITLLSLFAIVIFAQSNDTINANSIIEKYLTAIGGREKLDSIKDRTTEMTGLIHELNVRMTIYQKKPNLFKQLLKVQEIEQTVIFDGKKGILKTNEEKKDITGNELDKLKIDSDMNFMLSKDTSFVKFQYAGLDTVGIKKAYKIIVNTRLGSWNQYYDMDSGFRIKDEKPMDTPQGNFVQRTWYYDFKEVNGLRFPFRIVQVMGKQAVEFTVVSVKLNQHLDDSIFRLDK